MWHLVNFHEITPSSLKKIHKFFATKNRKTKQTKQTNNNKKNDLISEDKWNHQHKGTSFCPHGKSYWKYVSVSVSLFYNVQNSNH